MGRYVGPPGDDRIYYLPRDRDDLDVAFDRYYSEHPEHDPSKQHPDTSPPERPNAWEDVPF